MEKNCSSAAPTNSDNSNTGSVCSTASGRSTSHTANSLRTFNKSSYKISKPVVSRNPNNPNPARPSPPPPSSSAAVSPQPPVYNIDKSDFRDVVQKLTGSPAHRPSVSTAPPLQPPSRPLAVPQQLSRLHRIRPPPLARLTPAPAAVSAAGDGWVRPPLSPLPPFPAVSAAAESPISAYMRRFHSGQGFLAQSPPATAPLLLPLSPLSFGCAPSPRTGMSYQIMMANNMMFPNSSGLPIPSPK